jgi:very-short-patch-repair endonuclease
LYAGKQPCSSILRRSEVPVEWHCIDCQHHKKVISPHALHKHPFYYKKGLSCRICNHAKQRKQPSEDEVLLYGMLSHMPIIQTWRVEERVLMVTWGAADVYMPDYNAVIMVDGQQHFPGDSSGDMHGNTAAQQHLRDLVWNVIAHAHGISVLRLHYQNACQWRDAILKFISRCPSKEPMLVCVPQWKYTQAAKWAVAEG